MIDYQVFERLCEERNLKHYEIAEKAGLSKEHLSMILNNKRPNFSLDNALKIAKALDTPLSVLTGEISIGEWKVLQAIKNLKKQ